MCEIGRDAAPFHRLHFLRNVKMCVSRATTSYILLLYKAKQGTLVVDVKCFVFLYVQNLQ
jgi:hypothetical protein